MIDVHGAEAMLADVLGSFGQNLQATGAGRWRLDRGEATLIARVQHGWLCLEEHPAERADGSPQGAAGWARVLRGNAGLPPCVRFALDEAGQRLLLLAEVPVDEEAFPELADQLSAALAGIDAAARWYRAGGEAEAAAPSDGPLANCLSETVREAGWQFTERKGGDLAVQLEVRGFYQQAIVESPGQGQVRTRAEIATLSGASARSHAAVAALLLRAARSVRLARPIGVDSADGPSYGWEVLLGEAAAGDRLPAALASLSVACELTACEVRALADASVAERFLDMQQ